MQMFLTRLGFGSRIVVTGDITQIDLPREQRSGLVHVMRVLEGVPDISFVRFSDADVVRHKLVQKIVNAYKEARRGERPGAGRVTLEVEVQNRSGWSIDEPAAAAVVRAALAAEGVTEGELGLTLVAEAEMAELNAVHRGKSAAHRRAVVPAGRRGAAAGRAAPAAGRPGVVSAGGGGGRYADRAAAGARRAAPRGIRPRGR